MCAKEVVAAINEYNEVVIIKLKHSLSHSEQALTKVASEPELLGLVTKLDIILLPKFSDLDFKKVSCSEYK
jgi:hypothetical protein